MAKNIFRLSIENAFYFSFAIFVIAWIAGFLYEFLLKTSGRMNIGVVLIIVLTLALIMFLLGVANILLSDEESMRHSFGKRLLAIFLFALSSAAILILLAFLFWYKV